MSPMINGTNLTEACAKALVLIASTATDLDEFDPRVPRTLAKNGLASITDDEVVVITDKGRALVKAHQAKHGGDTEPQPKTNNAKAGRRQPAETARKPRRDGREKPAPRKDSPPPTGVVDFDALRARIVAHYEADLAACDRMREIAERVG